MVFFGPDFFTISIPSSSPPSAAKPSPSAGTS